MTAGVRPARRSVSRRPGARNAFATHGRRRPGAGVDHRIDSVFSLRSASRFSR